MTMTPLRQRMSDDLHLRNYSDRTVKAYLRCVRNFALHFGKSPDELGPAHIREYQLYLVKQKQCSWAVFNQTVCALRFFYNTTHDHLRDRASSFGSDQPRGRRH